MDQPQETKQPDKPEITIDTIRQGAEQTPGANYGEQLLKELLADGIAFAEGVEFKFEADTKGSELKFVAKNPFGVVFNGTVNGSLTLKMVPQ